MPSRRVPAERQTNLSIVVRNSGEHGAMPCQASAITCPLITAINLGQRRGQPVAVAKQKWFARATLTPVGDKPNLSPTNYMINTTIDTTLPSRCSRNPMIQYAKPRRTTKTPLHRANAQGAVCCVLAALSLLPIATLAQTAPPSYTGGNVKIVAGGYVDGIIAHPKQQGLFYARTDVGRAYRYSAPTGQWVELNDWVAPQDSQWTGVESIAVDPNNANMLCLVAGLYTPSWAANGAVLESSDQGAHSSS